MKWWSEDGATSTGGKSATKIILILLCKYAVCALYGTYHFVWYCLTISSMLLPAPSSAWQYLLTSQVRSDIAPQRDVKRSVHHTPSGHFGRKQPQSGLGNEAIHEVRQLNDPWNVANDGHDVVPEGHTAPDFTESASGHEDFIVVGGVLVLVLARDRDRVCSFVPCLVCNHMYSPEGVCGRYIKFFQDMLCFIQWLRQVKERFWWWWLCVKQSLVVPDFGSAQVTLPIIKDDNATCCCANPVPFALFRPIAVSKCSVEHSLSVWVGCQRTKWWSACHHRFSHDDFVHIYVRC